MAESPSRGTLYDSPLTSGMVSMRSAGGAALVCLSCAISACGGRGAVHVAPDESQPHISWEIRSGAETGDDEFVCGSARPSHACTLRASTPERSSLATVRLYLHAARRDANYRGQVFVPFIEGAERLLRDREVNVAVPSNSKPVGSVILGRVTSEPGRYTYAIELDAIHAGEATSHRIVERVPVTVR